MTGCRSASCCRLSALTVARDANVKDFAISLHSSSRSHLCFFFDLLFCRRAQHVTHDDPVNEREVNTSMPPLTRPDTTQAVSFRRPTPCMEPKIRWHQANANCSAPKYSRFSKHLGRPSNQHETRYFIRLRDARTRSLLETLANVDSADDVPSRCLECATLWSSSVQQGRPICVHMHTPSSEQTSRSPTSSRHPRVLHEPTASADACGVDPEARHPIGTDDPPTALREDARFQSTMTWKQPRYRTNECYRDAAGGIPRHRPEPSDPGVGTAETTLALTRARTPGRDFTPMPGTICHPWLVARPSLFASCASPELRSAFGKPIPSVEGASPVSGRREATVSGRGTSIRQGVRRHVEGPEWFTGAGIIAAWQPRGRAAQRACTDLLDRQGPRARLPTLHELPK